MKGKTMNRTDLLNVFFNEDCRETMKRMPEKYVDVVLTSPFYNTNFKSKGKKTLLTTKSKGYSHLRYDVISDVMDNDAYCDFTVNLFEQYDKILKKNGVVLYNMSYGSENTECLFRTINSIITRTPFTVADCIVWKKPNALPNNVSPNRLTRIFEFIFVFCRRQEEKTFYMNKKVVSTRANGQKMFENVFNFIEAKNNDGSCPYNKATFSSDFCVKLLKMYAPLKSDTVVYDSFMGSGTTAIGCLKLGLNFIGSEISEKQVSFSKERVKTFKMERLFEQ